MNVVLAQRPEEREAVFAVRQEVFVAEQGVPLDLEADELDATADHFLLYDKGAPVGAARLVTEPPGFAGADPSRGAVGHLGRLAVRCEVRGRGGGADLVRAVETSARGRGLVEMALAAQTHAVGFYERFGYRAHGPEFDDAGIPHRWMRKSLEERRFVARASGSR